MKDYLPLGLPPPSSGNELHRAEVEYYELLHKNVDIELACDRIEQSVLAMRGQQPVAEAVDGGQQQQQQQAEAMA